MAAKNTLQFFLGPLLKKFFQDMGRDPNNLEMILLRQKAGQLLKDSNKVIQFPQKRSFAEEIELMKKSGDLVDEKDMVISDKITEREMFKNSNLNKPTIEGQMEKITGASNRIKEIQKEIDEMYRPKTDAEIKAKYDKQNKESIQKFKDKMKKDDPEDKADGGRIGYYTGGITDVEPSLDDIGHGSDSLMSRTRLMSPGSQATTSTGLNYLLAEDNDNLRIPFAGGESARYENYYIDPKTGELKKKPKLEPKAEPYFKYDIDEEGNLVPKPKIKPQPAAQGGRIGFAGGGDPKRRAFLKLLATLTGGIAGVKSGFIGLGEGTAKKAVSETVKKAAGSGTPPPYFFKLVEKIKTLGDDVTAKNATQERQQVTRYKDFELTEDVGTGEKTIQRIKTDGPEYYDEQLAEEVYMNYKPGAGQSDEAGRVADEYIEDTGYLRTSGPDKGELYDSMDGLTEDSLKEIMEEIGEIKIKKADGGRIGFRIGGSGKKFIEKIFGKGSLDVMKARDPELHKGMLEVVDMFRNRDKEGLKMYLQKFLPHMDDETIEAFIVGDAADAAGQGKYGLDNIQGQLIRLGSGRDYAGKIEMMKKADNMRKLDKLDVDKMKPNANGGLITMLGE